MNDSMCERADWDGIEKDVVKRIRLLRGICQKMPDNETNRMIVRDLVLPNVRLLGQFCESIKIKATADGKFEVDVQFPESKTPAHCMNCGHITRVLPRPHECPGCGGKSAWASQSAPFPTAEQAAKARANRVIS